jgi:hypothetical protein
MKTPHRLIVIFLALIAGIPMSAAASIQPDSVAAVCDSADEDKEKIKPDYSFKPAKLILPLALTGLGAWGVDNGFLVKQKRKLQDGIQDISGGHKMRADDYLRYVPEAMSLVLPYMVKNKHLTTRDQWLLRANAYIIMGTLVLSTNKLVDERRPSGGGLESFPSGHAAGTFMSAEIIRIEYGGWYGTAAYAVAFGVGFMRMYNNQHWLNDVVGGAGIGILSARLGYWLLPLERKLFGWDKHDSGSTEMTALPFCNLCDGWQVGASFAIRF